MVVHMSEPSGNTTAKKSRISQADIPAVSLEQALRVPHALVDVYASKPTRPLDVAVAVVMTPSSGPFRTLCGAAVGYGLTDGGPNAPQIALTPLGRRALLPIEVGDDQLAKREAARKPTIAQQFYERYDGSPLPPKNIAQNVLATFGVPQDRTSDVYEMLMDNAEAVGFIKKIKDKPYLDLGAPVTGPSEVHDVEMDVVPEPDEHVPVAEPRVEGPLPLASSGPTPQRNAIFVGHGGNRKPTDQLVKILTEYGIPHKVAIDEPNRARPIPQKVADTMAECGAAILVFTADKEYFDRDGNSIWRPSENVSHELGAASVLYGERIVVFKERGIELPSNFSSVGYIEFEKDKLSDKGIDLFRELVTMKILNISVS